MKYLKDRVERAKPSKQPIVCVHICIALRNLGKTYKSTTSVLR